MNGTIFIISIASQLTYFYDAQSGLVEKCILEVPATLKVQYSPTAKYLNGIVIKRHILTEFQNAKNNYCIKGELIVVFFSIQNVFHLAYRKTCSYMKCKVASEKILYMSHDEVLEEWIRQYQNPT